MKKSFTLLFGALLTATALADSPDPKHVLVSRPGLNPTVVKAAPAKIKGIYARNKTKTIYYLRMYNRSTPACHLRDGFVQAIPIPANGGVHLKYPVGAAFSKGICYCLAGGPGSTDITPASSDVRVTTILYK